ncbi:MAG: hypothetical protein IKM52_03170, partial [Clostridia bacterium]|nr:hypothetical protein [Clostridia bacterium]
CGTPWSGKHDLDTNISVPLKGIILLQRGEENKIEKVSAKSLIGLLFNQIYRPSDNEAYLRTIDLVDELLAYCPLYRLFCTISQEAPLTAYQAFTRND